MISIWIFIGLLLIAYGALIMGQGMWELFVPPAKPVVLAELRAGIWLPEVADYSPATFDPQDAESNPAPPLARAQDWVNVELDLGDGLKSYRRETNTMPNWAGSCWYELRYLDPANNDDLVDPEAE